MALFDRFKKNKPTELPEENKQVLVIDKEQIAEATTRLNKYKDGKKALENRVIENDKWYRLRHWETMSGSGKQIEPTSAWLFNSIANKHADAMDNTPASNVLPREEGDKDEAQRLSSIIPVIHEQCMFEQTYSDVWYDKLKSGTGIYSVMWDGSKHNGLGDISIKSVDILNLFWEPGITDIQASKDVFHVELVDNSLLEQMYPQTKDKLGGKTVAVGEYAHDDTIDVSEKSIVVDWYYKKHQNGKTVLHFCKYVNGIVLYATENETQPITNELGEVVKPAPAEVGLYDHATYPFVFDVLYPIKDTVAGFGFIDIGRPAQEYIDRGNQAILKNMLANASPRYFIREGGEVSEKEFSDITKEFIHVKGATLGDDSIRPVQFNTMSSGFFEVINKKVEELKETTGNRDVNQGGTTAGATAASAIAAMQEAGSKLSRDMIKASFRCIKKVDTLIIELIRQFYDVPRSFRIIGERGAMEYVQYDNSMIAPKNIGVEYGYDMGLRAPVFDIQVTVEKESPYTRMSNNELMIQLYQMGIFNPQMSDQAISLLTCMDFDKRDQLLQMVEKNSTMMQQLMMMAQMIDSMKRPAPNQPSMTQMISAQFGLAMPNASVSPSDIDIDTDEPETTKKARERTLDATAPR